MDSFEWNKIAGAVLGTLIFVLVIKFGTEAIFDVEKPTKPGYVVEGVTEEASNDRSDRAGRGSDTRLGHGSSDSRCCGRPEDLCALRTVPRPLQGRAEQDRPESLGCSRSRARHASGLLLFRRDDREPRCMVVRQFLQVHQIACGLRARHKDELRRSAQRAGSHQPDRVAAHAERLAAADPGARARQGGRARSGSSRAIHTGDDAEEELTRS